MSEPPSFVQGVRNDICTALAGPVDFEPFPFQEEILRSERGAMACTTATRAPEQVVTGTVSEGKSELAFRRAVAPRVPEAPQLVQPIRGKAKAARNVPCFCQSGKKYKKCCGTVGNAPTPQRVEQVTSDAVRSILRPARVGVDPGKSLTDFATFVGDTTPRSSGVE